jgi:hypothetical protein
MEFHYATILTPMLQRRTAVYREGDRDEDALFILKRYD